MLIPVPNPKHRSIWMIDASFYPSTRCIHSNISSMRPGLGASREEEDGEQGTNAAMLAIARILVLNITPRIPLVIKRRIQQQAARVITMGLPAIPTARASLRVDRIGGHLTEILEVHTERPAFQVLFVPGNPGVVAYYQDYLEALYKHLDGRASVTAISHIAHVSTDWEQGRLFSLQEQIDHKIQFVREHLLVTSAVPLVLVGHSIGAHMAIEILKKFPSQLQHVIGLYPFVTLNVQSTWQSILRRVTETHILCTLVSKFAGLVGRLPNDYSKRALKLFVGRNWDHRAVDVTCQYLLQTNVVHNALYLGRTEFGTLPMEPDWPCLTVNQSRISFLFGANDHWGPLSLLYKISTRLPKLDVAIEREGHLHAFCCTVAGSDWVASHTATTIHSYADL